MRLDLTASTNRPSPLSGGHSRWLSSTIDVWLVTGVVLLMVVGLLAVYSASERDLDLLYRQALRYGVALLVMLTISQVHPRYLRMWTPWFYAGGLVLLGLVLVIGTGAGASRWLNLGVVSFQPAEISKLAVPMMLAWFLARFQLPPRLLTLLPALLILGAPCALIVIQPDLGTAIMIGLSGLMVLYFSGIAWRYIIAVMLTGLAAVPVVWSLLHEYQRNRVRTFLDPESDPLGQGWNIIQSMTAVGSGGLGGKGWLHGTQSHLEFLPEPHTDFIMAVIAEEFGLLGVIVLLALYTAITLRGLFLASQGRDSFARMLSGALILIFCFYAMVNIAMVSGLLPVVGVPLPMISYGGSSAVTLAAGFGILLSLYKHRKIWS